MSLLAGSLGFRYDPVLLCYSDNSLGGDHMLRLGARVMDRRGNIGHVREPQDKLGWVRVRWLDARDKPSIICSTRAASALMGIPVFVKSSTPHIITTLWDDIREGGTP